jgi:hypothetical protein
MLGSYILLARGSSLRDERLPILLTGGRGARLTSSTL